MFNSQMPDVSDLPTSRQLVRSTLVAAGAAAAILVTVVLPSEYGVDPTGVGRVLGLTEMGEIKVQLAQEAAADAAATPSGATTPPVPTATPPVTAAAADPASAADAALGTDARRDQMSLTLAPGETVNDAFRKLSSVGIHVSDVRNPGGRLEEVFLKLIKE